MAFYCADILVYMFNKYIVTWCFIFFSCLLLGCTNYGQKEYENYLDQWLHKPEAILLDSWGTPDQTYHRDGQTYLLFDSEFNEPFAQVYNGCGPINSAFNDMGGGVVYQLVRKSCKITFIIEHNVVSQWLYRGDGCILNNSLPQISNRKPSPPLK